jgi:hypothetical protein
MRYLFVHQNFPGQFVHVAAALAAAGHQVVALGITGRNVPGVHYVRYEPARAPAGGVVRGDLAAKMVRAEGCASAMLALKAQGFEPDVIVAHPGWGEALYCKDVWPQARLVVFAEFYYTVDGSDYDFDPEFQTDTPAARMRLRLKNTALLHALAAADAAYAPTHWQKSQVPPEFPHKVEVIFDGIDNYKEIIEKYFIEIGIFENIESSMERIAARLRKPYQASMLERVNVTERTQVIADDLRNTFIENNELEYEVFNYVKSRCVGSMELS